MIDAIKDAFKDMNAEKKGRPLKEFNRSEFEGLCSLQCTEQEICAFFGCSDKTLMRWVRREYGDEYREEFGDELTFRQIYNIKSAKGRISLRRWQFKQAEKNPTMAIWLGKNWLEQTDNVQVEAGNDTLKAAREILSGVNSVIE